MEKGRKEFLAKLTKKMFRDFGNQYFDNFTKSELLEIVEESNLSEDDKQIVILKKTQNMSYEQIADKLNLTNKTCFSRMAIIEMKLFQTCVKMFIHQ